MIQFDTITEVLEFLEGLNSDGLILIDEDLIVERLREYFDLEDDYEDAD